MFNYKRTCKISLFLALIALSLFLSSVGFASLPDPASDGACSSWAFLDSLGGCVKSEAAVERWNGRFILAAQGCDNGVYVNEWNQTSFTGWYHVPAGVTLSRPKLVLENASLWMYVQGGDGMVYRTQYLHSGNWSAWVNMNVTNSAFGKAGPGVSNGYKSYLIGSVVKLGECVNNSAPRWAQDLIIYQAVTKEFTSPNGPESGNFTSLKEKMPYLADLGITAIWLDGHSLADPHFHFNIWNQYPCIRPDVLEPTLGTEQDFRDLINEAHKYNIKIFLDVVTHGIVNYSSLVSDHPGWFYGSSWRMADYDWSNVRGDQKELENWWVDMWTNYVTNYGVDGYRLDLGHIRTDLWARVKKNAEDAGHPIFIISETYNTEGFNTGVYDMWEWDKGERINENFVNYQPTHSLRINYSDGGEISVYVLAYPPSGAGSGSLYAVYNGINVDKVGRTDPAPDGILDEHVSVNGVNNSKTISDIVIRDGSGLWALNPPSGNWYVAYEKNASTLEIYFSPYENEPPIVDPDRRFYGYHISSHNDGAYYIKGSRYRFGYEAMFVPVIPLFISGEEFNTPYNPVPNYSRCIYPNDTWWCTDLLMASQVQWDELNKSENRAFFEDCRKMISLRKNETTLNYFAPSLKEANLIAVYNYTASIYAPPPYIRWLGSEAILVVGNSDKNNKLSIAINLLPTLDELNLSGRGLYEITDLWDHGIQFMYKADLGHYNCTVSPDNFRLLKIIPANDAQFINQSVPSIMVAGQRYSVSVTMKNNGSANWTGLGENGWGTGYKLGVQNPENNFNWNTTRGYISAGESVAPGQTKTYTYNVTAPRIPGNYSFQWRMVQEWVEWFGDYTPNIVINVVNVTSTTTTSPTTITSTTMQQCIMSGNNPPCGVVSLSEVVSAINQWATGDFKLGDIVGLINSWANPVSYPPN